MIRTAAGDRVRGQVLVNGSGVGVYVEHLAALGGRVYGLDIEYGRVQAGVQRGLKGVCGAGEALPFPAQHFDLILSHEVLEHVADDRQAVWEMARTLRPGGRIVLFTPNRGYPFETHGVYWRERYRFGNIPLVNYLPDRWRDRLAPHVRVYRRRDLDRLFHDLPVQIVQRTVIFGAYDNLIVRWPRLGRILRKFLQSLERTPLRVFGLSHFWVVERVG
jgi:SAM-dependent methyltransferase